MRLRKRKKKDSHHNDLNLIKIDFSLKREVLYVVVGAIIGGILMSFPRLILDFISGSQSSYTSWIVFGHVIGVYSDYAAIAGFIIHLITAISIGIATGIFLYKTNILNISKPINGLLYGLFAGLIIFVVWAIPINEFILIPENIRTIKDIDPSLSEQEASEQIQKNKLNIFLNSLFLNLEYGITVGVVSSILSIKFGTKYKCNLCNVSFSRIDIIKKHLLLVHNKQPIKQKKVVILGGGFAGIQVLNKLQKTFQNDIRIDITILSKDNFFVFTPMLHEVSSGMIETRHVAAPLRSFCKRARFLEAEIKSIDLSNKTIEFTNNLFENKFTNSYHDNDNNTNHLYTKSLDYDYLVIALGSNTNFFGNKKLEETSFTMKNLYDAFYVRSHIIDTLEQTDMLLYEEKKEAITNKDSQNSHYTGNKLKNILTSLTTYVVVGGGFAGVETVGEINSFIRELIRTHYQNIDESDIRIILINSGSRILPEMDEKLADFALQELKKEKVEVILNDRVIDVKTIFEYNDHQEEDLEKYQTNSSSRRISKKIILKNNTEIICDTLIWTAGVVPEKTVIDIPCDHDKSGKVITDKYLQIKDHSDVYAIGDCAATTNSITGKLYPPTAQHAIRQGQIAADNIILSIKNELKLRENKEDVQIKKIIKKKEFSYKTRGIMATIGKRNGVAMIFGHSIKGIIAWGIWRYFYLTHLPTLENKIRVTIDWTIDMIFGRNITRLKSPIETTYVTSQSIDK
ncbi:MAG: FAD-dependent oxidoreductase [Nitrososphaeraceae archaeon]